MSTPITETARVHGPNWAKWLSHLAGKPDIIGMEIGTFKGESAEWFLQNVFTHATAKYWCVDPFTGSVEHKAAGIDCSTLEQESKARLSVFPQVEIVTGYSQNVLRDFNNKLDFIYIDGSHTACDVLRDSVLAFEILKVGGVCVWDDYGWDVFKDPLDRPEMAINHFLLSYSRKFDVIHRAWQVAAIKKSE